MPLTDAAISKVPPSRKPVKLSAGNGLILEIRPSGRKFWRYRYRLNGKENMYTAGEYCRTMQGEHPAAAAARIEAACYTIQEATALIPKWRAMVEAGTPPAGKHKSPTTDKSPSPVAHTDENPFFHIAMEWAKKGSARWSPSYERDVRSVLAADVFPYLGSTPIRAVSPADILAVLQRIEGRGSYAVANNARQWISSIFAYAISTLRAESNPTLVLRGALATPKVEHHKDMNRRQAGELLHRLRHYDGNRQTAIAVELLLLTFVRTNELRRAQWEEFDLDRAEWRIPASRMKARRPHVVPLSVRAMELLKELRSITGATTGLLFVNQRTGEGCMGYNTINHVLDKLGFGPSGEGFSAHCFRSTASTLLNEEGFMADAIERQLAHVAEDRTRASYNHGDLMEVRKGMMQAWADMLASFMAEYAAQPNQAPASQEGGLTASSILSEPPNHGAEVENNDRLWLLAC